MRRFLAAAALALAAFLDEGLDNGCCRHVARNAPVETHMRNTFRKLDVVSRVEVARVVERADRVP